ncbi:hypothetical protein BV25DRAFT_1843424 [Artomyces pyxidatus]|uniref:Uncharacterized protein n=1 Tax=Artomyces pyxidatus TaxID=48021 RepID=A0ACB8SE05_9AGAM|nr:hypothetical protein BV25DRAFT_1843424 [Artomyces pyxidatus]
MSASSESLPSLHFDTSKRQTGATHYPPRPETLHCAYVIRRWKAPSPAQRILHQMSQSPTSQRVTYWVPACCPRPPVADDDDIALIQDVTTHFTVGRVRAVELIYPLSTALQVAGVSESDDELHILLIPIPWVDLPWYKKVWRRILYNSLPTFPAAPAGNIVPTHHPDDHCPHIRYILNADERDLAILRPIVIPRE